MITAARSRGELAPALPIAQVAINDIPTANLINCMVLWYCMVISPIRLQQPIEGAVFKHVTDITRG